MSDFTTEIRARVAEAQHSLIQAGEAGDDYLVRLTLGELESLARIAADHQVPLDGVEESLAAHGLSTPSAGISRVLDLAKNRLDLNRAEVPDTIDSAG